MADIFLGLNLFVTESPVMYAVYCFCKVFLRYVPLCMVSLGQSELDLDSCLIEDLMTRLYLSFCLLIFVVFIYLDSLY